MDTTTAEQQRQAIVDALAAQGLEAMYGKGGFWVRRQGWMSFSKARRLAGVAAPERVVYPKIATELSFVVRAFNRPQRGTK